MISRHWQTRVNGNWAANASLIQSVRRCGNQVTLLGSKVFSVILFISIFDPHPVFDTQLHFSLISTFFRSLPRPHPDLGCGVKSTVSAISPQLELGQR